MEAGREIEKIGSTGRALPHVEIPHCRLARAAGCRPTKKGEICMRGPKVTKGYWNAPGEDRRGVLRRLAAQRRRGLPGRGRLPVRHRPHQEDMILTSAENVAPARSRSGAVRAAADRRGLAH